MEASATSIPQDREPTTFTSYTNCQPKGIGLRMVMPKISSSHLQASKTSIEPHKDRLKSPGQ